MTVTVEKSEGQKEPLSSKTLCVCMRWVPRWRQVVGMLPPQG